MPPQLTSFQQKTVDAARKTNKPTVYSPTGTDASTISNDFESWLILTPKGPKSTLLDWLKTLLQSESDKPFEDLLKETVDSEKTYLDLQMSHLEPQTSSFDQWIADPGISGWQDVTEIGWLMQELQQGLSPYGEKEEVYHLEALRKAVEARFPLSTESVANREQRINAWITALNSY